MGVFLSARESRAQMKNALVIFITASNIQSDPYIKIIKETNGTELVTNLGWKKKIKVGKIKGGNN